MNKLNNQEEELKDILEGLEIDIDTNDIWANIESELPQPKKNRKFGILFLFGLIGLGLVGLGWNLGKSANRNIDTLNVSTSSIASSNNKIVDAPQSTSNSEGYILEKGNQQENLSRSLESTNSVISQKPILSNSISANNDNKANSNTSIENNISKESNANIVSYLQESEEVITKIKTNTFVTINNDINIALQEDRNSNTKIGLTPTLSSQLFDIAQRQRIESSPSSIIPLHDNGRQLILQFKLGANQNRTSISNINSVGEFDASEFNFERDRLGLSTSFAVGMENNGWRFLAGVSYHHHVSSYERDDILIVKDLETGIESYKISTDGNSTAQTGLITVTSARDNKISYHRQHRAIDFHATLGKRLWSYKGFVLMADAGLGINALTHSSGYYLADKAFGFTKISEEGSPYKANTSWNAIASLELGYDFGKTRIGISPFIRYNPNSITQNTHLYTLKNSQVGMQLSLTYSPTRE